MNATDIRSACRLIAEFEGRALGRHNSNFETVSEPVRQIVEKEAARIEAAHLLYRLRITPEISLSRQYIRFRFSEEQLWVLFGDLFARGADVKFADEKQVFLITAANIPPAEHRS